MRLLFVLHLEASFCFALGAQAFRFDLVPREVIEARLQMYKGNNLQREATLKEMFAGAGCDDKHLSE